MKGFSYSALQEKNRQETSIKLKELGVDSSKAMQKTTRKRGRKDPSFDEDDWTPSPKQSGRRRGRNPVPNYVWNSDDPDFDGDDPAESETSEESETSRSASRGRPRKVNTAVNISGPIDLDINLFCDECSLYYEGDCPVHGALTIVKDTPVPRKPKNETRARKTVPLEVRIADSKTAGGAWAKNFIPARTLFGPYQGQVVSKDVGAGSQPFVWEIKRNGSVVHCVDASDPGLSNWMRYVKRARHDGEQNLNAYQYQGEIYFRTIKDIEAREQLVVYDGFIHGRQPRGRNEPKGGHRNCKKTNGTEVNKTYKCPGCNIAYISQDYVDRHVKTCRQLRHNDCADQIFKCTGCQCAFSSVEYFERHKKVCRKNVTSKTFAQMFKCTGCKCAYATEDYLERHKKICRELGSTKIPRDVFQCPGCKCAYSVVEYLDRHKKVCRQLEPQKPAEETYKCSACQTAYTDPKYLERHKKLCRQIEAIKASETPINYECSACHSVYTDKMFLERHQKICEGAKNKYFGDTLNEEEEVDRIFDGDDGRKTPANIPKRGILKCSGGGVEKKCPFVLLERIAWFDPFLHEKALFNVLSSKPLKCPDCNEPFSYKARLDTHRLVHLGQTVNVCDKCDMAFCNKKLYAEHVESH